MILNKTITSEGQKDNAEFIEKSPEEIVEIIKDRIVKLNERLEIAKSI